jgi:hypothetical protein
VAALDEPLGRLAHERIDVMAIFPGVGRDLGDAKALGHQTEGYCPGN